MSRRNYNKLFLNKNRTEGSEKLVLGYQQDLKEIVLYKDKETVFHIASYTDSVNLANSGLIERGAIGGYFPAASDRIFENRKNYGNSTSNGSSSKLNNGTWFCSWLYKNKYGNLQWMDRYFVPGNIVYTESIANALLSGELSYDTTNPVYKDVPSTLTLTPGVMYRYFHIGENTSKFLVSTFAGISGEHLKLNLENWGLSSVDTSATNAQVKLTTKATPDLLYSTTLRQEDELAIPCINFNNNFDIRAEIDYSPIYNLSDEFSLSFWAQSEDWSNSQTTQLFGNFSSNGGYGVFIETLSSYPYFGILESGYGHLLAINEQFNGYMDQSLQPTPALTATPEHLVIDSNQHMIICFNDFSSRLIKLDHTGKILKSTSYNLYQTNERETPLQLICGPNDSVVLLTNKTKYTFDTDLNCIRTAAYPALSTTVASYLYNTQEKTSELIIMDNVYDSKFIETTNWCISATNGNLYKKSPSDSSHVLFARFANTATNFAIDPYERLWVLHGNNQITIIDSKGSPLNSNLLTISEGLNSKSLQKNISFICQYNRNTNNREWKTLLYSSDPEDHYLYVLNMEGELIETTNLLSLFNDKTINALKQDQTKLNFYSKGDFTGYERKRVFDKLPPYNNVSQIVVKALLKDKMSVNKNTLFPFTLFKSYIPIDNWPKSSWQHITLTLQNKTFALYVNGKRVTEMQYTGQYELNYDLQPNFTIGTPNGSIINFNQEIGCSSLIFNGLIGDIKLYDYCLTESQLELFQRAVNKAQDIYWQMPMPDIQHMETVERMFKNKIPGAKATYYNIKLSGTNIKDPETRKIIEQEIKNIALKIQPAYANFLNVHWTE